MDRCLGTRFAALAPDDKPGWLVGVVVAGVGAAGHLFHGDHAAFENLAILVFELDGGVADIEVVFEHMPEPRKNSGAFRWGNVVDGDVTGQGAGLRAETPAMEVVDVEDAGDAFHACTDVTEIDVAGRAFEEDVEGFAHDTWGCQRGRCAGSK